MIFFCGIPIPNNWISPLTVGRRVAQGKFSAAETFDIFDPEKVFPRCMHYIRKNRAITSLGSHVITIFISYTRVRSGIDGTQVAIKMSIYMCARVLAKGVYGRMCTNPCLIGRLDPPPPHADHQLSPTLSSATTGGPPVAKVIRQLISQSGFYIYIYKLTTVNM